MRLSVVLALWLPMTAAAQTAVTDPNGTVSGTILGRDITFDVLCEGSAAMPDAVIITSHTPLSQSLIAGMTEDAVSVNFLMGGVSILAMIDGAVVTKVITGVAAPTFPYPLQTDDLDIEIICPG